MELRIRSMGLDDIATLVAMERQIFPDPWPQEAFLEGLRDNDHLFLVAEEETGIVGYAAYYMEMGEARLTNIAVAKPYRRKSVAKKILNFILEVINKAGCKYIFLDVRPSNAAAITFYRKFGFYDLYRRPDYYRNPVEDALVMVKNLTQD